MTNDAAGNRLDGPITVATFATAPPAAIWTGATSTNLGAAGNWNPVAIPNATQTLTFNAANGGTLTGTATGLNAAFSGTGTGAWVLQGATATLAGLPISATSSLAMTEAANLTVNGGSIAASGRIDIESASGAAMTVASGAKVNAQGMGVGLDGGQSGTLGCRTPPPSLTIPERMAFSISVPAARAAPPSRPAPAWPMRALTALAGMPRAPVR